MKENAGPDGRVARGKGSEIERRRPVALCSPDRRDFGIALASLGAAAILGLPRETVASDSGPAPCAWVAVLASLGQELSTGVPVPAGSRCTRRVGSPSDEAKVVALAASLRELDAPGAVVRTPSGWLLSGREAAACRQIHALFD